MDRVAYGWHVNIFQLLVLVGIVVAGCYVGRHLASYWGIPGLIGGFILGVGSAVLVFGGLFRLVMLWHRWRPMRPPCRNGTCMSDNYRVVSWTRDEAVFQCGCGAKYVEKRRRFMELAEDGSAKPYMIKRGFTGRWERDEPGLPA
jgi:hypothetical protein